MLYLFIVYLIFAKKKERSNWLFGEDRILTSLLGKNITSIVNIYNIFQLQIVSDTKYNILRSARLVLSFFDTIHVSITMILQISRTDRMWVFEDLRNKIKIKNHSCLLIYYPFSFKIYR